MFLRLHPCFLVLLMLCRGSNGSLDSNLGSEKRSMFSFFSRFLTESAHRRGVERLSSSHVKMSTVNRAGAVGGIGANWGSQSSHHLPPNTVVRMLRENGIQKVKLFDADYDTLKALGGTGIEVMVGIPNDMLSDLASNPKAAEKWVSQNVSQHLRDNKVIIRYVAVGNEPFLETYNGSFLKTTFPALRNVQEALTRANLRDQVKVTVPLNADVYTSASSLPSGGDFRANIHDYMLPIVQLLNDNQAPFTVNIYPFISLYTDSNFPVEYAFFDGNATPVNDGGTSYYNMFDANHDTLVWALQKNGFGNLPIIVGEIGWPTDGDQNANLQYAQRFNQGFMTHIAGGRGTPMRPGPINAYLFSLIDEDEKSIQPGNFERHWGIFSYDGQPKYALNLGTGTATSGLIPARNVTYLEQKWCIMKSDARIDGSQVAPSVSYACSRADCTSLGYQTSCSGMDARGNVSYAFNSYYQKSNQLDEACKFNGLGTITRANPSTGNCRFNIMIKPYYGGAAAGGVSGRAWKTFVVVGFVAFLLIKL
ncbi:glucan endo-1,3-beta-glucosidase 6-like [Andrographis paniculata]|uniref:glucan endo-1,3-beta-glucosidase 6-like n=1 Tax=Andrographis paniculata TaxID=175694 RepID=UPI0021E93696|nr:glucan endo-1,3-beta-glucosidase 6-like [Andrographis paniculata]XP_051115458.1 glucan endo-1,3-beta-glucosidase 6-like [Andrographis paniculata]